MKKTFTFTQDQASDTPLWIQLRQKLVQLIATGYFVPGDQLPTVRGLASELSINYNTVNKAYMSLVSDGYLESTVGKGVFVCEWPGKPVTEKTREIDTLTEEFISTCRERGLSLTDIQFAVSRRVMELKRPERATSPLPGSVIQADFAESDADSMKASS